MGIKSFYIYLILVIITGFHAMYVTHTEQTYKIKAAEKAHYERASERLLECALIDKEVNEETSKRFRKCMGTYNLYYR